jgi:hypothetical protein
MRLQRWTVVAAAVTAGVWFGWGGGSQVVRSYGQAVSLQVEVMTRGPIHEAFAQPVPLSEEGAETVSRTPPAPLAEEPPDEMPEGDNVVWIPGYWSWDDDLSDFLWVSGCWRVAPPQCAWIPGYWAPVPGGWQWVPGFWTSADVNEVEYVPAPPPSLEQGPPGPPPSPDQIWEPGCWEWRDGRHVWRQGFWQQGRADWVWEPAHYVSTPRGCIFVDGYWDYATERRGILFAPVHCPPELYAQAGFAFSPSVVVDLADLTDDLFCRPGYDHYYFGDYYDARYERQGFFPWYAAGDHHQWFDPIYSHQQWRHRDDRQWDSHVRAEYDRRRRDPDARPAHTLTALQAQIARLPEAQRRGYQVAQPFSAAVAGKTTPFQFQKIAQQRRADIGKQAAQVHDFGQLRGHWEAAPAPGKSAAHGGPIVGPGGVRPTEIRPIAPSPARTEVHTNPPPVVATPGGVNVPRHEETPALPHPTKVESAHVPPAFSRVQHEEPAEPVSHKVMIPKAPLAGGASGGAPAGRTLTGGPAKGGPSAAEHLAGGPVAGAHLTGGPSAGGETRHVSAPPPPPPVTPRPDTTILPLPKGVMTSVPARGGASENPPRGGRK